MRPIALVFIALALSCERLEFEDKRANDKPHEEEKAAESVQASTIPIQLAQPSYSEFSGQIVRIDSTQPAVALDTGTLDLTKEFTYSLFVFPTVDPSNTAESSILEKPAANGSYAVSCRQLIESTGSSIRCGVFDAAKKISVTVLGKIPAKGYALITVKRSSDALELFVDGKSVQKKALAANLSLPSDGKLLVGTRDGSRFPWQGRVGQIEIWSSAQDSAAIGEISVRAYGQLAGSLATELLRDEQIRANAKIAASQDELKASQSEVKAAQAAMAATLEKILQNQTAKEFKVTGRCKYGSSDQIDMIGNNSLDLVEECRFVSSVFFGDGDTWFVTDIASGLDAVDSTYQADCDVGTSKNSQSFLVVVYGKSTNELRRTCQTLANGKHGTPAYHKLRNVTSRKTVAKFLCLPSTYVPGKSCIKSIDGNVNCYGNYFDSSEICRESLANARDGMACYQSSSFLGKALIAKIAPSTTGIGNYFPDIDSCNRSFKNAYGPLVCMPSSFYVGQWFIANLEKSAAQVGGRFKSLDECLATF